MKIGKIFIYPSPRRPFSWPSRLIQSMNFAGRSEPLQVYGPEGTSDLVETITSLGYFQAGFEVPATTFDDYDVVQGKGYSVMAVRTDHTIPSYGFSSSRRMSGRGGSTGKRLWNWAFPKAPSSPSSSQVRASPSKEER